MIKKLHLKNFTVFEDLTLEFKAGVNLFIGANGTGKTHLLKVLYAMVTVPQEDKTPIGRIAKVFLPHELRHLGTRTKAEEQSKIEVGTENNSCELKFNTIPDEARVSGIWRDEIGTAVFIPVKEILANAPGFRSLYHLRDIPFEAMYAEILDKAYLFPLRDLTAQQDLLLTLQEVMGGKITIKGEQFYLSDALGELEFMLVAEGIRKFALLWLLIRNGCLQKGATLFWDEPEANLNPSLIEILVKVLLQLQRQGVQIFIATHNYVLLEEFNLQKESEDAVRFFSLSKNEQTQNIDCQFGDDYMSIMPNKISEAYTKIYDKEVHRTLGDIYDLE